MMEHSKSYIFTENGDCISGKCRNSSITTGKSKAESLIRVRVTQLSGNAFIHSFIFVSKDKPAL